MKPRWVRLLVAFVFLCSLPNPACCAPELVFVQAIWRHGSRAPLALPYPNDPYTESAWQRGWQQLTNMGMAELNELGDYFRRTYDFFISAHYVPSEVYVRSSDSDRALTSAQAFLSGFYPANGSFQWEKGNTWQPIPVHAATPGEPDLLTKPTSTGCGKYDELVEREDTAQAEYYNVVYGEMFEILENETGIANFSYKNVNKIYDIKRELDHGLVDKQPAWVFRNWTQYNNRSTMDIVTELRTIRMITKFNSTQKANMVGGYLLNNWLQNAKKVANGTMENPKKMLLYSSHDGTILALMYALGVANNRMVPYASALIMEIYKNADNYTVELKFRNSTAMPPYRLSLPNCESPCTVDKMINLYNDMMIANYSQQQTLCGTPLKECNSSTTASLWMLSVMLLVLQRYTFHSGVFSI